jgi:hypothetical protein
VGCSVAILLVELGSLAEDVLWQAVGGVVWYLYSTCFVGMTPTQWVAESTFGTVWGFVNMSGVLLLFEFLRKRWR